MKLATFEVRTVLGRMRRLGLVLPNPATGDSVMVNLNGAHAWMLHQKGYSENQARRWADFLFPDSMRRFLELGDPALDAARQVQSHFDTLLAGGLHTGPYGESESGAESLLGVNDERLIFRMADIRLLTPVPNPPMLRDFLTFETHAANGFSRRNEPVPEAWYKLPVYYKGNPHTLIGHEEPAPWPHYTRKFDYELELACIVGKEGRNIPVEEAGRYIAGYAVMNDFSARDIQKHEMLCRLGPAKAKDFATAVGPWLVTADEIPDPRNLRMTAKINGELWSDGNSGTSHWTFEQMIAHVSMEETIRPGDILGSGTVGFGSGFELDKWLQPGDVVELEIEGLGVLRNRVNEPVHG